MPTLISEPPRARSELPPGTLVGARFIVGELAKRGGMGHVYRAVDRAAGDAACALKVLPPGEMAEQEDIDRFEREAEVLSQLRHPGIVSYIAHGFTADGRPYLAMEWLDGDDLASRLASGRLDIAGAVALLTSLAEALGFAHQSGIVHRDLKPANVILRDGDLAHPALVDFGVARWLGRTMSQTRSGALIGTPGYMAPEQARGQFDVGPSADVFALGCILFEGLTGKAPFGAEHVATILTKILFEEVPPVRSLRPEVPRDLEALCARLLSKEPSNRPKNGAALLAELGRLSDPELPPGPAPRRKPSGTLSGVEQMLFSLVIASPSARRGEPESTTLRAPTSLPGALPLALRGFKELGVQLEYLADGSIAVFVSRAGSATEQVAHAARCALMLADRMPDAHLVLVTGRGSLSPRGRVPEGEVFDRASALLTKRAAASEPSSPTPFGIWLDDVSAGLLDPSFLVTRELGTTILVGVDAGSPDVAFRRPLLGRSIPCLGRERELSVLMAMLDGAVEDAAPSAAIVIAPAGMGKSRLFHEVLARLRRERPSIEVLYGRSDPSTSLSPFSLLARALRQLAGAHSDDAPEEQRRALEARLGLHLRSSVSASTLAPLLEIASDPATDDRASRARPPSTARSSGSTPPPSPTRPVSATPPTPPFSSTSTTPPIGERSLETRVERAFLSFVAAECAAHPLVIAIEDLHAADAATARLLDVTLRSIREAPLFVLATQSADDARPRPAWHGNVQEIRLGGLGKRASERLVRLSLGDDADPGLVARLIEQAAGNPLYLEELIRAHSDGKSDAPPETVLAMLQARILRMSSGARRALRIASLFGQQFWRGGLLYVLGLTKSGELPALDPWLEELLEAEMIELHPESRFRDDVEYGFRHGLIRDAAYGLLTEDDQKLGRALVAIYLEQAGEHDPAILAGHTYEVVQYLERRHTSFFVSRLCMLTGLSLRKFTSTTPDDPVTLKKIRRALDALLQADQVDEVKHLFRDA